MVFLLSRILFDQYKSHHSHVYLDVLYSSRMCMYVVFIDEIKYEN